jgi:hypothetical protein
MDAWELAEGRQGDAEMPGDDVEILDEVREAEESSDGAEGQAPESTEEVREPFVDLCDGDPLGVREGDTEPPRDPSHG